MNNKFKVINENNNELEAEIITVFNYKDKEYVIYSINNDNDKVDICVSRLEKDEKGYSILKDIISLNSLGTSLVNIISSFVNGLIILRVLA